MGEVRRLAGAPGRVRRPFAPACACCVDAWKIDHEIISTRGGAIAIGHPLGTSGGRILDTLAKVLRERGEWYGMAAICIGVGQGLAIVLENTDVGFRTAQ
jgi:acetyl-CoA acyltransferase